VFSTSSFHKKKSKIRSLKLYNNPPESISKKRKKLKNLKKGKENFTENPNTIVDIINSRINDLEGNNNEKVMKIKFSGLIFILFPTITNSKGSVK